MSGNYIIDENGEVKIERDIIAWAKWFETGKRSLARDEIGPYQVSTVFLGVDYAFGHGSPILWETMVFGLPSEDEICERYTSRTAALAGHAKIVEEMRVKAGL